MEYKIDKILVYLSYYFYNLRYSNYIKEMLLYIKIDLML